MVIRQLLRHFKTSVSDVDRKVYDSVHHGFIMNIRNEIYLVNS